MKRTIEEKDIVSLDLTLAKSLTSSDSPPSPIDPEAERKLRRKCDRHIIPILCILFSLSFIDRINIGNAKIQGLEEDLGMSGNDYNIALFVFFVPYILFEVPSNMILKRLAPSTWLSLIMFLWGMCPVLRSVGSTDALLGLTTLAMGFVTNLAGLVACRFFLGAFEAGFVPGQSTQKFCTYLTNRSRLLLLDFHVL